MSLIIPTGLFGLLGPNGAGKSTLMRTIATLQSADSGSIQFGDIDVLHDKESMCRRLGYLPQEFGFYPTLSASATLHHFAALKGFLDTKARNEVVARSLEQVNLYGERNLPVRTFSGGMRQRLGIAIALLNQPEIVIVDEPTAGLDPRERIRFLNLLSEVAERAVVILSTHIVDDVSEFCERMAIIANGRVVAQGSPNAIVNNTVRGHVYRRISEKSEMATIASLYRVVSTRYVGGRPVVYVYSDTPPTDESFEPVEADLEHAYFYRVGEAMTQRR